MFLELQSRKGVLENALSNWKERYSDIVNIEELDIVRCSSFVHEPNEIRENSSVAIAENDESTEISPKCLKGQKWVVIPAQKNAEENSVIKSNGDDDSMDSDDQYFEVSSANPVKKNGDNNAM